MGCNLVVGRPNVLVTFSMGMPEKPNAARVGPWCRIRAGATTKSDPGYKKRNVLCPSSIAPLRFVLLNASGGAERRRSPIKYEIPAVNSKARPVNREREPSPLERGFPASRLPPRRCTRMELQNFLAMRRGGARLTTPALRAGRRAGHQVF